MNSFVFASANDGKVREVRELFAGDGVKVLSLADLVESDEFPQCVQILQVDETENSYRGNALLKARAYNSWSGFPCVADDSGLEVSALDGAPGIYTSRFAGEGATSAQNRVKMLSKLEGAKNRSARFVCVLCYYTAESHYQFVEAELRGRIAETERGSSGFGYDSIFEVENSGRTLSEIKEKGGVETHRSKAFQKLRSVIVAV